MLCSVYFFGSNCQIPVLIRRCNSGATCAVTSTHITIILESLPKPGDDTLGDSKFLEYFQLAQKHQACLNEIQRLKSHGAQGGVAEDGYGTLTITNMELPLKRDFIAAQLEGKTSECALENILLTCFLHSWILNNTVDSFVSALFKASNTF
ncbi:hypothetical protein AVEN_211013-1 [Araneus ventricosus]|uniref:Uncharacterized protein n=1 Tax=Araneus ventricosus TaxID=182803 RepID=A0A4Y2C667_ARAVE|nr:hypothetical protein AVEN_171154-1 [Araneus ventricosus]GBL99838.1 hypothetical protein AVEN_211013-1 [Araneus ventricosus]